MGGQVAPIIQNWTNSAVKKLNPVVYEHYFQLASYIYEKYQSGIVWRYRCYYSIATDRMPLAYDGTVEYVTHFKTQ